MAVAAIPMPPSGKPDLRPKIDTAPRLPVQDCSAAIGKDVLARADRMRADLEGAFCQVKAIVNDVAVLDNTNVTRPDRR